MTNRRTVVNRTTASSLKLFASVLFTFLLVAGLAFGQERFGELNGVATDATGAVLPNVAITMTEARTARSQTTKTDGAGAYIVRNLEPGTYTVTFEVAGFTKYQVPNVIVQAGRVLKVDAQMSI